MGVGEAAGAGVARLVEEAAGERVGVARAVRAGRADDSAGRGARLADDADRDDERRSVRRAGALCSAAGLGLATAAVSFFAGFGADPNSPIEGTPSDPPTDSV
ncbi:MAG TPA: hypothetical protein VL422_11360, partial [Miltoncostaea sp.]|nr:hypothetical protein [Miltoncostaea sp.]